MRTRTVLSTALLAIVALVLAAPVVGQSPTPRGSGLTIHWQIFLRGGETANSWAQADYDAFTASIAPPPTVKGDQVFTKFVVTAVTPYAADGTKLGVFIGPSTTSKEPYGKLVGLIEIGAGSGGMVLVDAKTPIVQKGTTVTITNIGPIPDKRVMLKGTF